MPRKKKKRLNHERRFFLKIIAGIFISVAILTYAASFRQGPDQVDYGATFSIMRSEALGLDWRENYNAVLDDLGVKKLRLVAYWPQIEPERGIFNFHDIDYQMNRAAEEGASVILAIGKRLPGWPECHRPKWYEVLAPEEKDAALFSYIEAVVKRYKEHPALSSWQVENEPFLSGFATQHCEALDAALIKSEIETVRRIDPERDIVITDSGEFGRWILAYKLADVFGSTMYLYVWHDLLGPIRYPIRSGFFNFKQNVVETLLGKKPMILIELGLEPWLNKPIAEASLEEQFEQMSMERFEKVLALARESDFEDQYVWGVEWWYHLKQNHHSEFWEKGKELFKP